MHSEWLLVQQSEFVFQGYFRRPDITRCSVLLLPLLHDISHIAGPCISFEHLDDRLMSIVLRLLIVVLRLIRCSSTPLSQLCL